MCIEENCFMGSIFNIEMFGIDKLTVWHSLLISTYNSRFFEVLFYRIYFSFLPTNLHVLLFKLYLDCLKST